MSDDVSDLHKVLNLHLGEVLGKRSRQDSLPIPTELILAPQESAVELTPPITPQAEVCSLEDDETWDLFSRRFTEGTGNPTQSPWFRCLGILRGHGARAAVIE